MKISETAFYLLGANNHSSRTEIRNLVEEKSFIKNEQDCRNAGRNLLQLNMRIEQETAWIPGVPPEMAARLLRKAEKGQFSRKFSHQGVEIEIPALAACNLLSETVQYILNSKPETIEITQFDGIVRVASELYDLLDPEEELARINTDREIAGFVKVADKKLLEECIEKQRKELSAVIYQALSIFDEDEGKVWFSNIIEELTSKGTAQLPLLLEELVFGYELKKKDVHAQLEEEMLRLISEIRNGLVHTVLESNGREAKKSIEDLKSLLKKWSSSVYPILIAYKSKGFSHKRSEKIISEVRDLYIKAVDEYNDEEIFSSLGESLAFAIDTVPKFSDLVKNDLLFLHGRFRDLISLKKIKTICSCFQELPESKDDIIAAFNQVKQQLPSEIIDKLGEYSGDWLCLFFIKYGAALANDYGDYKTSISIFKEAQNLPTSSRIKELLDDNIRRVERNRKFLQEKKLENEKNRRQYAIKQEKIHKINNRKNIYAIISCAVLSCGCALGLWYIQSSEYEWDYISTKPLKSQMTYLRNHPLSDNRKQLSKLIVRQIAELPKEQMSNYASIDIIDEDAAFEELTTAPTIQSLALFLKLFPDASASRKRAVHELQIGIAERDWASLSKPYALAQVEDFLSTYEGIVEPCEIQRRVCSSIIQSTDAAYIASFQGFVEDCNMREELVNRIEKIETGNWVRASRNFNRISELVSYREKLISERVRALVDQRIEELEEKTWRETYANCSSETILLNFQKQLRSEKVKKMVDCRLQELYSSFSFAQQIDTIEAYNRFIALSYNQEEKEKARRRIIDLEVAAIAQGQYSVLPPQHGRAYQYTRTGFAEIEIENDTAYPLTAMYSGGDSKKVVIPAHKRTCIKIRPGEYAIAVTTTQPKVTPFYGKENIGSGKYQVTYYISSVPSYLPRSNYSW